MEKRKLPLVIVCLLFFSCKTMEHESSKSKIIDGVKIPVNSQAKAKYPSAVGLIDNNAQLCTGARVSSNQILTAAHCTYKTGDLLYVRASNGEVMAFKVTGRVQHPLYTGILDKLEPDIAIITVNSQSENDRTRYQKFTENSVMNYTMPKVGDVAFVVGGGCENVPCNDDTIRSMGAGYLKYAKSEIVKLNHPLNPTNSKYFQLDSYLFASGEEGTIHSGDSGGPVFDTQNRQIGVTSQGGGLVDSSHVMLAHPDASQFLKNNIK